MGDSGSQVIGLTLAALGLATSWKVAESTIATLILPLLVLAVPILDTALVTAVRLVEGRPVHQGGQDHASHRLVRSGISEKGTVVLLAAIAAGLGATSLAYSGLDNSWVTLVGVLVTFALLVQLAGFLTDIDETGEADADGRPVLLRRILLCPRRLVELIVDFALITASFTIAYLLFVHGLRHRLREAHLPRLAARDPRRALPLLHPGRALQRRLALRRRARGPRDRRRRRRLRGARRRHRLVLERTVRRLPRADLPRRRSARDRADRRLPLRRASAVPRALDLHRPDGRRRTLLVGAGRSGRSLLRELRETPGEQRRRLRRRRPAAERPPHAGRSRARRARRDRPRARADGPDARPRHDPGRAARAA